MSHATICLLQLVLRNNAKSNSMCHVQLDINCVAKFKFSSSDPSRVVLIYHPQKGNV